MIELRDVRKVFRARGREVVALDGVDLVARRGEVLGVVGRSGAGKSTLIRCVNRLEQPTAGTIVVDGQAITRMRGAELRAARRRMGMIFQHFNLLSSRTALDNVALPLEIAGVERRDRARRAAELLELVGLADRARSYPSQLSDGQKQRVGIARALAAEPAVLLSDEATSALDGETTSSVLGLLRDLNERLGLTVLLITHEMEVVKRVCDSVALLRDGRVVESGLVGDVVARPDSSLAESLLPAPADRVPGSAAVDVVLLDRDAERSVAAALSGALGNGHTRTELEAAVTAAGAPVHVAGGSVEMIGGRRVGRLTLAPEGGAEAASRLAAELRARGARATEAGRADGAGDAAVDPDYAEPPADGAR